MNDLAIEFRQTVEAAAKQLRSISESQAQTARSDGQWTAKEILGHLIDSAANNHQRFVRAQFTDDLVFTGYDQEQWVRAQHYDQVGWAALIQLWQAYNLHLAHVVANIPDAILLQRRARHTLNVIGFQKVDPTEPATLAYLIGDYLEHLRAHLRQIEESLVR
jgi:hypothetical protein